MGSQTFLLGGKNAYFTLNRTSTDMTVRFPFESSLFLDVTHHGLVHTGISRLPSGPTFRGQAGP